MLYIYIYIYIYILNILEIFYTVYALYTFTISFTNNNFNILTMYMYEELNYLYSSPNTVRVIKSRRMRWAGHVARMREERGLYRVLVGKPER